MRGDLPPSVYKFYIGVAFCAVLTNYIRGEKAIAQYTEKQNKSDSSSVRDAINSIPSENCQLSQEYINTVKDVTVNMNRLAVNQPQLRKHTGNTWSRAS